MARLRVSLVRLVWAIVPIVVLISDLGRRWEF